MHEMLEIQIETLGGEHLEYPEDVTVELLDTLVDLGAVGPAISAGGRHQMLGATFSLDVLYLDPANAAGSFADAARAGVEIFETACEKVGVRHGGIGSVWVLTGEMFEREISNEPETYLGVTEVARELNVSRQRISELRQRPDFPAPLVELAAGPVWRLSTLRRFVDGWDRKPGRPRDRAVS